MAIFRCKDRVGQNCSFPIGKLLPDRSGMIHQENRIRGDMFFQIFHPSLKLTARFSGDRSIHQSPRLAFHHHKKSIDFQPIVIRHRGRCERCKEPAIRTQRIATRRQAGFILKVSLHTLCSALGTPAKRANARRWCLPSP